MAKYKEYTIDDLNLESEIKTKIDNKEYPLAVFLAYSAIECLTQKIILMTAKEIDADKANRINKIRLPQSAIFLYYQGEIKVEILEDIEKLISKRHEYAHYFIKRYLSKKAYKLDTVCKLYRKIFRLYKKHLESK
ncbi:MAG TPA: hypothetical protein ENI08_01275 [Candidatus Dependentiae bacterium]|nr:hypothetical protein [Candidatus Dependentiae bacterium]